MDPMGKDVVVFWPTFIALGTGTINGSGVHPCDHPTGGPPW